MQTFSIIDLDDLARGIRDAAAASISDNHQENLDDYITIEQIKQMIIDTSLGVDNEGFYIIDENIFDQLFEDTMYSIYQSGLAKLAANNSIECAWDDDTNQMVFWTKN